MGIQFHCEHCGKKIKAKDGTGGKWAKCPSCHNKVYIPNLSGSGGGEDELKLTPIDEADQKKQQQLMAETYQLRNDLLQEEEEPTGQNGPINSAAQLSEKELTKDIILYLRQTADGELDSAKKLVAFIAPCGDRTIHILDRIGLSEIPEPELADIPPQVLAGLIRALRSEIHPQN
ncbi:hypothetical protein ACFL3G_04705 [Planctomycetota bacterium]